jgi:aminopeptidase N
VLRAHIRGSEAVRRMARIANCLAWSAIMPLAAAPPARMYTVENYDVSIQADLAKQRLYGEVSIRFHSRTDTDISVLELDAGGLTVASVVEGQAAQSFERNHGMLFVVLTKPLRPDEPRTITVRYQAGPAAGLKFFPDQVYTSAPSDWMPCNDGPGERATLHLTIAAPPDTKAAGSGQLTATRASEGRSITEWRLDVPTGPSWFGFAVGAFAENTSDAEGVKLRVLGADAQIFEPTAAAMHYLAERTGKRYPGQMYTQVFTHGDAILPLAAGLTLLPESFAQGLVKQPDNLWVLTSELAHQWYGVGIATKDWSDLWLSEGVSAYMANAFLGQRLGRGTYEREIQRCRLIYNQVRAEGKDRSLSDTGWTTRQEADGEIPEYKGASFLYLVSVLVGDSAFWNGLRLYTSEQWGRAAASEDMQKAFDAVNTGNGTAGNKAGAARSKKNRKDTSSPLDNLFDLWVYGIPNTPSKKHK